MVKNPHENHSTQSGDFLKLFKEGFLLFLFFIESSVAGAYHNVPFISLHFSLDSKLVVDCQGFLYSSYALHIHTLLYRPSIFLLCLLIKPVSMHRSTHSCKLFNHALSSQRYHSLVFQHRHCLCLFMFLFIPLHICLWKITSNFLQRGMSLPQTLLYVLPAGFGVHTQQT